MNDRRSKRPVLPIVLLSLALPAVADPVLPGPGISQLPPVDEERTGAEPIVTGKRDIVVNGRARHCYKLRKDPLDSVDATPPTTGRRQSEVVPVGPGKYAFQP